MAKADPKALLDMIAMGRLEGPNLTFAVEHAGRIQGFNSDVVAVVGEVALSHPKGYVREGAVYGLAQVDHPEVRALLEKVAAEDVDADVRDAAREALE